LTSDEARAADERAPACAAVVALLADES